MRFHYAWSWRGVYEPFVEPQEEYYETGLGVVDHRVLSLPFQSDPSAFRAPAYPLFIAAVEAPFEAEQPGRVRLAQAALSTLALAAAQGLAAALAGPWGAVAAGAFLALDGRAVDAVSSLNVHGFFGLILLALALAAWRESAKPGRGASLLHGACLSAALLTRTACFPYLILWPLAVLRGAPPRRALRRIFETAAVVALLLAPVVVRGRLRTGEFLPFDGLKASYLAMTSATGPAVMTDIPQALAAADSVSPGFSTRGLSAVDEQKALLKLATREVLRHPLRYTGYCLARLWSFWSGLWLLAALALACVFLLPAASPAAAAFAAPLSLIGYALAGGAPEYRVSAVPALCALAGAGAALLARVRAPAPSRALPWAARALVLLPGFVVAASLTLLVGEAFPKPGRDALTTQALEQGFARAGASRPQGAYRVKFLDRIASPVREREYARRALLAGLPASERSVALTELARLSGSAADETAALASAVDGEGVLEAFFAAHRGRRGVSALLSRALAVAAPDAPFARARRSAATAVAYDADGDAGAAERWRRAALKADAASACAALSRFGESAGLPPRRPPAECGGAAKDEYAAGLLRLGRRADAAREFASALAVDPDDDLAAEGLIVAREGRAPEAAPRPGSAPASRARRESAYAAALALRGDSAGAEKALDAAFAADADSATALGGDLAPRELLPVRLFDLCVARRPRDAGLLADRAIARHGAGDDAGAVADLRAALALRPDALEAALSLAALDPRGGSAALAKALDLSSGRRGDPLYRRGRELLGELRGDAPAR